MLKKIMIASVAIGAIALNAPLATAAVPAAVDCEMRVVAQEDLTGGQDTFTGVVYGYITSLNPTNPVSIRCYVTVDGAETSASPTGTGTGAAATTGQVTFTASNTQDVALCAEWTDGAESGTKCEQT